MAKTFATVPNCLRLSQSYLSLYPPRILSSKISKNYEIIAKMCAFLYYWGMKKTNAMRILDNLKIPYETVSYDDDGEHELSRGAAEKTAEKLGIDPQTVFKTIVMRTDTKEICVFLQSAMNEINLKKARNAAGCKEIAPVKPDELLSLTGYVRGGCSPLGMRRKYRTFFDETILLCDKVHISAGVRGEELVINPQDLVKACDATVLDLTL